METFSTLLALCAGNSPVTGEKASDAEFWCFLWSAPEQTVEYRDAGDFRPNHTYYDVTVMCSGPSKEQKHHQTSDFYLLWLVEFIIDFWACLLMISSFQTRD